MFKFTFEYNKDNDLFGINIKDYVLKHEEQMNSYIDSETSDENILDYHLTKLYWLQHERLVHLIVTCITIFLSLSLLVYTYFNTEYIFLCCLAFVICFILLIFYLKHYFFLENHVQHWYKIYDKLYLFSVNLNEDENNEEDIEEDNDEEYEY